MSKLASGLKNLMAMKWSGRKLGTLLFFQIQASIFLCVGKLDGGEWAMLSTALFTIFVSGVVVEKGQDTQTTRMFAKSAAQRERSPRIDDSP